MLTVYELTPAVAVTPTIEVRIVGGPLTAMSFDESSYRSFVGPMGDQWRVSDEARRREQR
jgi:hypothetical protein